MRSIKNIHFVGIGGAGMGGIAELLHNQGYNITGSDIVKNPMIERLTSLGINIKLQHDAKNILNADAIVITSALNKNNPEWLEAKKLGIPIVRRAEMLSELMRLGQGIAIAGTHGKTTVTSILASIMVTAKLDPTFVIGGKLNSLGANSKLGKLDRESYFIAEADESDASFLYLNPIIAVITNIDRDHMLTYGNDINKLYTVFIDFLRRLPFYGLAVINIDNIEPDFFAKLKAEIRCQIITYGTNKNADYCLADYKQIKNKSYFIVKQSNINNKQEEFNFSFNLPGKHNALNALAAYIVADQENVDIKYVQQALESFPGINRRFQIYENINLNNKKITLIDDYGHHPCEIKAMIDSIRSGWPNNKLIMVFQPHRYTRTLDLKEDFAKVLSKVDELILLPVYAASEQPVEGGTTDDLYNMVIKYNNSNCCNLNNFDQVFEKLSAMILDGDIIVIQGAGDISKLAEKILDL